MILRPPFIITARLLPGLQVGKACLALEDLNQLSPDQRAVFRWYVDLPDGREFHGDDLKSGVLALSSGVRFAPLPGTQEMFSSFLSFLTAAAESWPDGENADLFPAPVAEWAAENSEELSALSWEVEETKGLIVD